MKKILSLLLALIMCLTVLTACDVQGTVEQVKGAVAPVVEQVKGFINGLLGKDVPPADTTEYHIDKAESFLKNMYKDVNPVTGADYEVVGQVRVAGVAYAVTWASNSEQVKIVALESGNYLVDLNEKATEDVAYTLTATITAGNGQTATVVYNRTIPMYNVLSWDAYMAAQKGDVVLVEGIVVAMNGKSVGNSRNHLFLMDASGKGGYYSYQMPDDCDPVEKGVKVGMTVSVSGTVEPYSGMQEIKGGTFAIVDETIKTVTPIDITEFILAGNTDFSEYVALPVTIKGVTLGSQDLATSSSQYLYFEIAGIKSYVRTYVTDFPTTLDAKTATAENADKAAIDKLHADHFGYTADVTGILILYSGNPYLIPMSTDCFTNLKFVEKTTEEKVDAELAELKLEGTVTSSTVVDILTVGKYYDDVAISWTSDSEYAVVEGNKLTLTVPSAGATAKITATVTCGDVTKTKEFTVKLSMKPTAIADIITLALSGEHNVYTTDKYIVAGVITEVYNTTYGNMKITDEHGNILTIYGTYGADGVQRYDALESKPVAGDYVVVLGVVGRYNDTPQVKNGWILSFTTPTSIEDANTIGAAKEHNTYTEEKHLVTGVVTEIKSTTYGNAYIKDEAGNTIYIYGMYDQSGARFDSMTKQPKVGDTITVLSAIGQYNGTVQLKNATVVVLVAATTEEPTTHVCEHVCETCQKCTDKDCTEEVCASKCEGHETVVHPEGVVDPVVGTAYAFGMVQKNKDNTTYYLKGGMNGYYLETTENIADSLHVYIEETTGGYYLYCFVDGAKTYINCVVSGTHVNGAYEATASTVYTYDAESKTLIADVDGTPYWFGTRNDKTYTTVGPCAVSYKGFYCQFYNVDTTTPVVPAHKCESVCPTCEKCTDKACTEEVCASKCEGHTTTPVEITSVTYSFATTSTKKGEKLTNNTALALFTASGSADVLTSVTVENIYDGNGDGGAYSQASGFVKAGKSKTDGTLVLNFGDKKVAKVEIKCHDWYKASADHPTNSNKVSVNGSAEVLAPYNEAGTPEVLTFTVDNASSITIVANDRVFIFEIVVTFAE